MMAQFVFYVGSLTTNKQRLAMMYDTRAAVALAHELAGLASAS